MDGSQQGDFVAGDLAVVFENGADDLIGCDWMIHVCSFDVSLPEWGNDNLLETVLPTGARS